MSASTRRIDPTEAAMKQQVPIKDFVEELLERIERAQTIDCCREEIKLFAKLAKEKIPDETIEIDWK